MAFKPKREPIALEALGCRIAARKAELGLPDPPRNAGKNRTASKRMLRQQAHAAQGNRGSGVGGGEFRGRWLFIPSVAMDRPLAVKVRTAIYSSALTTRLVA